jgi:heptosyltransferase I
MSAPSKILVVRLSSLGDILHALPAFRSLRESFPDSRIDWIVEERMRIVLSAVRGIDHVRSIDTRLLRRSPLNTGAWRAHYEAIRALRATRYDCAIDFQGLIKTAVLSCLSGARVRIGFGRQLVREPGAHLFYHRTLGVVGRPLHVTALNGLLAELAGGRPVSGVAPALEAPPEDNRAVDALLRSAGLTRFVILNPGGGWYTKRWSPTRYGSLAAKIRSELGLGVVVTTGPGEQGLYDEISRHSGVLPPVHMHVPFLRLIPLIQRAHLLVGGDTGPFHLACALGTPVVGILGPTSPVRNGPWRDSDEAVVRVLPCSFCNGRSCPTRNECMDISVDEVYTAVVRRLGRPAG